jgi:adenine-specific DNA-methyltransferase
VRYIGSKARVAAAILDHVGLPDTSAGVFVDAFCGTGSVASEAAQRGWSVRVNDHLLSAALITGARLASHSSVPYGALAGYGNAVEALQGSSARRGFVWANYSPASATHGTHERRYFTQANASQIDGMRATIAEWARGGLLTTTEEGLLLADLILAATRVANTAGTYGCFLRDWTPSALRPIELLARPLSDRDRSYEVLNKDVWDVPFAQQDVAYLDPPYTKRQYAAYYHILETIAHGDDPVVEGVTGLRPWREKASPFCYKSRALEAIASLIRDVGARRVFLSYSSEGHVPLVRLERELAKLGSVAIHRLGDVGRYRPNGAASANGSFVSEFLIELTKSEEIFEPSSAAAGEVQVLA